VRTRLVQTKPRQELRQASHALGDFSSATKEAATKKEKEGVGSLKTHGPALFHVTEKLVPLDNVDGKALTAPLLDTIVIS